MYNEDDLVVVSFEKQSPNKIFGLIRTAERIIDKARLHKSFRTLTQFMLFFVSNSELFRRTS